MTIIAEEADLSPAHSFNAITDCLIVTKLFIIFIIADNDESLSWVVLYYIKVLAID